MLVTFFIMGISLAVVLGIGVILIGEIGLIRDMGESVKALYIADIGIEEALYLDRKEIPAVAGATRGLCDICNSCLAFNCTPCESSGGFCDSGNCKECTITYSTIFNGNRYQVISSIALDGNGNIKSYGSHERITRAIELNIPPAVAPPSNDHTPVIYNAEVVPETSSTAWGVEIRAQVFDSKGDVNTVTARIYNTLLTIDETVAMTLELDTYQAVWSGPEGAYDVDIEACDLAGNCGKITKLVNS